MWQGVEVRGGINAKNREFNAKRREPLEAHRTTKRLQGQMIRVDIPISLSKVQRLIIFRDK